MGRPRRITCRVCERHIDECGQLSARGKCFDCGVGAAIAFNLQMHNMEGEALALWREGMARSVGAIIPPKPPVTETEKDGENGGQ